MAQWSKYDEHRSQKSLQHCDDMQLAEGIDVPTVVLTGELEQQQCQHWQLQAWLWAQVEGNPCGLNCPGGRNALVASSHFRSGFQKIGFSKVNLK